MGEAQRVTGWRISVDTGGTFTDVVVADDSGRFTIDKALTTPDRIFNGLSAALANAAESLGLGLGEVLARTGILIYGSRRAVSASAARRIVSLRTTPRRSGTSTSICRRRASNRTPKSPR